MKYSNAAIILATASSLSAISASTRDASGPHSTSRLVYAGYCMGCVDWINDLPAVDYQRLKELMVRPLLTKEKDTDFCPCTFNQEPLSASADILIKQVVMKSTPKRTDAQPIPTAMMTEMRQFLPYAITLLESCDAIEELKINPANEKAKKLSDTFSNSPITAFMLNVSHEHKSFVRLLIAPFILLGLAAAAYASVYKGDENETTQKKEILILTDLCHHLSPASPMSLDTLKSAEDEVSKLREENKILKKKLDYFTLMERSIRNLGSICGDGNEADWNTTFPNASTLQALQQQVNELKEELERTKERLQSVIKTNIVLNDAHDRKHQESEALKEEMEKSWGKFEETYTSQRQEMSKVEEGSRKLANENDVLKLQNKELALRLSAAEQLINFM